MKSFQTLLGFSIALALISCSPVKKSLLVDENGPVYEIAVRQVKEGQKEQFILQRDAFIEVLTQQEGVSNDREFQSFYALPQPDNREVFIGMTEYESSELPGKIQSKWSILSKFLKVKKVMDLKAYAFVQPLEGKDFNLGTLAKEEGQVLELAVRRVKEGEEAEFQKTRQAFVSWLNQQEGVEGSWELKVVGGQNTENLTVGISVYKSREAFQAIAAKSQGLTEAGAYFNTFEPVALQYAISLK